MPFTVDDDSEINENDFKLLSWFVENKYESQGNTKDPYAHNQETYRYVPCHGFNLLCDKEDMEIENWADEDQGDRLDEASSSGYKIHISKRSICKYLQNKKMDMILQVELTTNDKKSEDKYKKKFQIYLLRQDGSIEKYEESEVSKLGEKLVKEQLPEYAIDTYGRWLLHTIAELKTLLKQDDLDKEELKKEYKKLINKFKSRKDIY